MRPAIALLAAMLAGCAATDGVDGDRIGSLQQREIDVSDRVPRDSLERAMESYRAFLEQAPDSEMTPEAMRRLADLKIQRGVLRPAAGARTGQELESPILARSRDQSDERATGDLPSPDEDAELAEIEERSREPVAAGEIDDQLAGTAGTSEMEAEMLRERADSAEAIRLYNRLLEEFPNYERRDQVLYQLARARGIRGEQDLAKQTLDRLVSEFPYSRHFQEAQFRRGEIFFVREQWRDAERAYQDVVEAGPGSGFFDQGVYKHGWSLFKQEQYREALDSFVLLIDKNAPAGREMIESMNEAQRKRMEDALRVMSFSFSYLGGPQAVARYFDRVGQRAYMDMIYGDLGDYFLDKERYADAAETLTLFVERNPLHDRAPEFQRRVISVYEQGGFPKLVLEAKKAYAERYAPDALYWQAHDLDQHPEILAFIKTNLIDLGKHYHALSQELDPEVESEADQQRDAVEEGIAWYREYIQSFPEDAQSPELNFLLADLLYDNGRFREAAQEYAASAYDYGEHERDSEAGFAAVSAWEQLLETASEANRGAVEGRLIDSGLRFAEAFQAHPKAAPVLTNAAQRLFRRDDFPTARDTGLTLIERYPDADPELRKSAWIVVAHSWFDLMNYAEAESSYREALQLTRPEGEDVELHGELTERLAASIYQQGDEARQAGDLAVAVEHFLRVGRAAPDSPIRETAEFDAATVLINLESWQRAATVLEGYRARYPQSERQADITKKLAVVYEKADRLADAAAEYEQIESDTTDPDLKRRANIRAAELYDEAGRQGAAIEVYQRYVNNYPEPVEFNVETRNRLAELYAKAGQPKRRREMLEAIVQADANAGAQRTPRTRYLAAQASLVLARPLMAEFNSIQLTLPLDKSLKRKKAAMERTIAEFEAMIEYGVAEVTAAATYHLGEIYYHFTRALLNSDRPPDLSGLELEQYEILLEERAFPFEEKAIGIHEKNIELMTRGVYNEWIEKSIAQLGNILPARYAKAEVSEDYVEAIQ
jgi:TolA-binding protein